MANYLKVDQDGKILAVLSDEIDAIPPDAIPITQDLVDEHNRSVTPKKWENGAFVTDTEAVRMKAGENILREFDQRIERAGLKAVLLQVAWLCAEVLPQVDISALPAQKQARINNVIGRLDKLAVAYRAKKQAKAELDAGADPATITLPSVDSLDD